MPKTGAKLSKEKGKWDELQKLLTEIWEEATFCGLGDFADKRNWDGLDTIRAHLDCMASKAKEAGRLMYVGDNLYEKERIAELNAKIQSEINLFIGFLTNNWNEQDAPVHEEVEREFVKVCDVIEAFGLQLGLLGDKF